MTPERSKTLYHRMLLIRRIEEALRQLFADGHVPGFVHLSIGQEAVPVGVSAHLRDSDTVSSNHRGHGHTIAKGVDPVAACSMTLVRPLTDDPDMRETLDAAVATFFVK